MGSLPADFEDRPLYTLPIAVVDTETTGLSPGLGHRVVEVAVLRLEQGREVGQMSRLVNPGRAMDLGASRVNGIYDEDLVDAPPFVAIMPELDELLNGAVIVAHNAAFDAGFLGMEYHVAEQLLENKPVYRLENPWLCTMQLAKRFFYFHSNSLGNIARELGVRASRAHRALNDVYTTAGILKRMARDLDRMGFKTAGDLLHIQGGAIYPPPPPRPVDDPVIAAALSRQGSLRIRYQGAGGATERVIQPLYMTEQNGRVYLVAHCTLRRAQRTFRLDRIVILPDSP